jgi:hypothetical protein
MDSLKSISMTLNLDDSDSEQEQDKPFSTPTLRAKDEKINHRFSLKQAKVIFLIFFLNLANYIMTNYFLTARKHSRSAKQLPVQVSS